MTISCVGWDLQTFPSANYPPGMLAPRIPYPCLSDCSGHGVCDEDQGSCSCSAGWSADDCNTFAFQILGHFSNTSELQTSAEVRVAARPAPTARVQCTIASDRPSEAVSEREAVAFVRASPQGALASSDDDMMVAAVRVVGIKDLLDDGDQQFTLLIGPCTSSDARFRLARPHPLGSAWNEDVPFPHVYNVTPATSSLVGQRITVHGRNFDSNCSVSVNGLELTGPIINRTVFLNVSSGMQWHVADEVVPAAAFARGAWDSKNKSDLLVTITASLTTDRRIFLGRGVIFESRVAIGSIDFEDENVTLYRESLQPFDFKYLSSEMLTFMTPPKLDGMPSASVIECGGANIFWGRTC